MTGETRDGTKLRICLDCPQRNQQTFKGYVGCDRHEFVCGDASKNVNAIMFHDRGSQGPADALGG